MVAPADVFHRALRCLLAYDVDAYADVFAEDAVLEWPFAPAEWPRRLEGRAAIREHVGNNLARSKAAGRRLVALHDLVLHEPSAHSPSAHTIVAEFDVEVQSADGGSARLPYVHVLRVTDDGHIASLRDYFGIPTARLAQSARPSAARQAFARIEHSVVASDADAFADAFATDGVLVWPFAPAGMPRKVEGREAIRTLTRAMMADADAAGRRITGYHDVVHHASVDPDATVVEFQAERRFRDGGTSRLPYVWIIETKDDRIVALRDYYDSASAALAAKRA